VEAEFVHVVTDIPAISSYPPSQAQQPGRHQRAGLAVAQAGLPFAKRL